MVRATDSDSGLETWWDDYARSLRRQGRSEDTIRTYRESFDDLWAWASTQQVNDPSDLTRQHVNAWVDDLTARDGLARASVAIRYRNARPFFTWWAKEEGDPAANPFLGADRPPEDENPPEVIHLDDIRTLLGTCSGRGFEARRDTAIIRVLFDTGIRLGEMAGMGLGDWDRRQDFVTVDGKTGMRVVQISPSTGEALARYLRLRASHPKKDLDGMWLTQKGRMTKSGISQMLARRCKQAGLPRMGPHQFRHTFSHEFRTAGGSEGDLMYLAGWKTTAMAHRYGKSAAGQRARESHQRIKLGDRL